MKLPRQFFKPLAIGAPAPLRDLPVRLERMIHFVPPHLEKLRQKVPDLIRQVDVVLGNLEDAIPADAKTGGTPEGSARTAFQQDLWHYTIAKMVDACAAAGIKPFYGPFGDFSDQAACEAQFRNSFLMGCAGAWSLHPTQVEIAKRVFSPDPAEVAFAKKILAAMPDGSGAVMIDGKMQDDATWKQAKIVVDLAHLVVAKDPAMAVLYRM